MFNPGFLEPMECLPVRKLPEGPSWTYEIKLDSYRIEAVPTGLRLTKEPADAKLDPHPNSFPGQIVEPSAVSAMNPLRRLPTLWADTPLTSRAKNHHKPVSSFPHQLIKYHFTGIRHQCSLSHCHPPETA
jgi:hypothetical protein